MVWSGTGEDHPGEPRPGAESRRCPAGAIRHTVRESTTCFLQEGAITVARQTEPCRFPALQEIAAAAGPA